MEHSTCARAGLPLVRTGSSFAGPGLCIQAHHQVRFVHSPLLRLPVPLTQLAHYSL